MGHSTMQGSVLSPILCATCLADLDVTNPDNKIRNTPQKQSEKTSNTTNMHANAMQDATTIHNTLHGTYLSRGVNQASYADDVITWASAPTIRDLKTTMKKGLDRCIEWCRNNAM